MSGDKNRRESIKQLIQVKKNKCRLDELVYSRGYAETIRHAQGMIMAGEILVEEKPVDKVGISVPTTAQLRYRPRRGHGYVSRGGLKLESALRSFSIDPKNHICLDLGMSTGGFTDCLLQGGANRVYGVDVGRGLAHRRLVTDDRVIIIEGVHVQDLTPIHIPEKCTLLVADLSFNSLTRLISPALPFLEGNAELILLIKPQFELSQKELESVAARGVVFDEAAQHLACERVRDALIHLGVTIYDIRPSETKGTKGNQEYFIYGQLLSNR